MQEVRRLRSGATLGLGRIDSQGMAGTYRNANCHAKNCLPFIQLLEVVREDLNIEKWVEAHNVHLFRTHDGREYKFRPLRTEAGGYIGIELWQLLPGKKEVSVFQITDITDSSTLIAYLHHIVRPMHNNTTAIPRNYRSRHGLGMA